MVSSFSLSLGGLRRKDIIHFIKIENINQNFQMKSDRQDDEYLEQYKTV